MNKLFTKIATLAVGAVMAIGVGVAAKGGRDSVKAEASDIEITFPGEPSTKTSAYTKTFTMTVSDVEFTFANWNNGSKSDSWDAIRGGQKAVDWTGTITSDVIANAVEKVVVNVTQVANSTGSKLEVASDSEFTTDLQTIDNGAVTETGDVEFVVPTQVENSFYRLTFTQGAKANGSIRVGKITYVAGSSGGETPTPTVTPTPEKETKNLAVAESSINLNINDEYTPVVTIDGVAAAGYELESADEGVAEIYGDKIVATGLGTTTVTVSKAEDEDYKYKSASITVNVIPAEPAHITGKTISEIVAEKPTAQEAIYEVTGYVTSLASGNGTKYGNLYIADVKGDTANAAYIYGSSANTGCVWNGSKYTFTNPQNFLTEELTANIAVGDKITAEFMVLYYKETFEFQGLIKSVEKDVEVELYFTNNHNWDQVFAYAWKEGVENSENAGWPGVELTDIAKTNQYGQDVYGFELNLAQYNRLIFTNNSSEQTVNIDISEATNKLGFYLGELDGFKYTVGTYTYYPHGEEAGDPLTFDEVWAIASALESGNAGKQYYVKATVVEHEGFPTIASGRSRFYVGNGENELYVYNCQDFDNKANFAEDLLVVGDEVVIACTVTIYSNNPQLAYVNGVADCYLVSVNGYGAAEFNAVAAALAAINCDANGVDSVIDWATVKSALEGFEYLKVVEADVNGNRLEQFMAKYDYIVAKYGKESYEDFLDRQPVLSESANSVSTTPDNNSIMLVVVVTASVSTIALGLLVFLRKKRLAK